MKNILKYLVSALFVIIVFASCKKDEHKVYFEGGTAPTLSGTATGTIPLAFASKDQRAIKLSWTNPDYQFTTGISSHDVSYQIEIDTTGSNFTNKDRKIISLSSDLSIDITQNDFNDYLLNQLQLKPAMPHNMEIRLKSSLDNGSSPLYSNILRYTVTPYAIPPKVTPPASGKLYITGSATAGNWMSGGDPELVSQKFTQISSTLYEITVALIGGQSYTFVPVYGDWNNKYSIAVKNDPNEVNGGDFQVGGQDILAPAASGTYKITVDFQRGKFSVVKQ
jgi:starch-binding outer membrane protein SusE/F